MNIKELITEAKEWSYNEQCSFLNYIVFNITIGIRSVWSDESLTADEKVDAIRWINEFNHSVLNIISASKNNDAKIEFDKFLNLSKLYAKQNITTKAEINFIIKFAHERIERESISGSDTKGKIHNP